MGEARAPLDLRAVGERWFADTANFEEEMYHLWGVWGCHSEVGRLRSVLMHRPGVEVELIAEPAAVRFLEQMEPNRARRQHDDLANIYREHDVEVHYVGNTRPDRPNALFVRDLVVMTPEGAIVTRPAVSFRRGEERFVAAALGAIGVPILRTICGSGTFEGANLMWVNRNLVFLGVGNRTNAEGARQVAMELERLGVREIVYVQIPYGYAHLDEIMGLADRDLALIVPWLTPFIVVEALQRHNFRIIEVDSQDEATRGGATNFVALQPGKIVIPAGNPRACDRLCQAGVNVLEAEIDELMKGWGAVHCMTAPLRRDD